MEIQKEIPMDQKSEVRKGSCSLMVPKKAVTTETKTKTKTEQPRVKMKEPQSSVWRTVKLMGKLKETAKGSTRPSLKAQTREDQLVQQKDNPMLQR